MISLALTGFVPKTVSGGCEENADIWRRADHNLPNNGRECKSGHHVRSAKHNRKDFAKYKDAGNRVDFMRISPKKLLSSQEVQHYHKFINLVINVCMEQVWLEAIYVYSMTVTMTYYTCN